MKNQLFVCCFDVANEIGPAVCLRHGCQSRVHGLGTLSFPSKMSYLDRRTERAPGWHLCTTLHMVTTSLQGIRKKCKEVTCLLQRGTSSHAVIVRVLGAIIPVAPCRLTAQDDGAASVLDAFSQCHSRSDTKISHPEPYLQTQSP